VRHKNPGHLGQPQSRRLSLSGINKHVSRNNNRRLTVILKPYCVVQTARYARPSVGQAFNDEVALAQHLLAQFLCRGPRRC
jgi:hypothetical protein